jgi:hypothetical protein
MKKLLFISETPLYEKIMDVPFPNRFGNYLEFLMKEIPAEFSCVTLGESWKEEDYAVIVTLGAVPTGQVLKLRKGFKMKDLLGRASGKIYPWYSVEYLFNRGKSLQRDTQDFLRKIL